MKGQREQDTEGRRRPYLKPEVKRVQLKPEEAVLGWCKISGNYGPVAANCKIIANCQGIGS